MKVTQVAPNKEEDGVSKYTQDLMNGLDKQGANVEIREINKPRSGNPFYWKNLGKIESDVVHVQFEYGLFGNITDRLHGIMSIPFYRQIDLPTVTTFHSVEERSPQGLKDKIKDRLLRVVDKTICRNSDKLIVHSEESEKILEKDGVDRSKIEVIPHGIRKGEEISKEKAREEIGIEEDKIALLFGFIRRSKGYKKAIRAIEGTEYHLVIAGTAKNQDQENYKKELIELAESLELESRIHFLGYIEDENIKYVMNAADCLLLPYKNITGSGVFSLGVAYKVPMLASDLDYFKEKEQNNLLTLFEGPQDLRKGLKNEAQSENLENYRIKYSWSNVAERNIELYEEIKNDA